MPRQVRITFTFERMRYRGISSALNERRRNASPWAGGDPDDPSQRATVVPPFDPQAFARESERITVQPPTAPATPHPPSDTPVVTSEVIAIADETFVSLDEATIPRLAVAKEDLEWFDLSAAAHAILDQIDGVASIEEVAARTQIALVDAVDLVTEMTRQGILLAT
jgi:hypothetical protein